MKINEVKDINSLPNEGLVGREVIDLDDARQVAEEHYEVSEFWFKPKKEYKASGAYMWVLASQVGR